MAFKRGKKKVPTKVNRKIILASQIPGIGAKKKDGVAYRHGNLERVEVQNLVDKEGSVELQSPKGTKRTNISLSTPCAMQDPIGRGTISVMPCHTEMVQNN